MDITTEVSILLDQMNQLSALVSNLNSLGFQAMQVVSEGGDVNPRVKAIVASADVGVIAINSQISIVQKILDEIAGQIK